MSGPLPEDSPPRPESDRMSPPSDTQVIEESLESVGARIRYLAAKMEQPILAVAVFLESIQDLESAQPTSEGGSRLVVAIQAYDSFRQEIQLVERSIGTLCSAIAGANGAEPAESPEMMLTRAAGVQYHLANAHSIIDNAATDIPHAITQVLRGAGVNSNRFKNWGVHRSLAELAVLTEQLGHSVEDLEAAQIRLAAAFGMSVSQIPALEEAAGPENEAGEVILF